ncbi:MAG: hypothetical protein Q4F54_02715 [Coriobacteriia bacterium]|nr:hypothetical protein [Coriobacteriia bacterium]
MSGRTERENANFDNTVREQEEQFTLREDGTFRESEENQSNSVSGNASLTERETNNTLREDNEITFVEDDENNDYNDSTYNENPSTVIENDNPRRA